jgi:tRNA(Ile)-lysidine synthase
MALADVALRTIRRHHMLPHGGRVVVALSGGADSVALLVLLLELQQRGELVVAGAAHLNHQLRGDAADEDERFCVDLAKSLDVPIVCGREDVRAKARDERRSIEDAARTARYAFLAEAAQQLDAVAVAVAHSLDDQAETFLLRLIRGSGSRGLGGIRPTAGLVIRPLLDIRRLDLREYLAARGAAFREDVTNADVSIPRNRVRHELLPYLEREFSPGISAVLAREATSAREDEEKLQAEAIDFAASIVLSDDSPDGFRPCGFRLQAEALKKLHPAIAARVARLALGRLGADRFIGFDHIQRFLDFIETAKDGAAVSLPGQQAVRDGEWVVLRPEPERRPRVVGT